MFLAQLKKLQEAEGFCFSADLVVNATEASKATAPPPLLGDMRNEVGMVVPIDAVPLTVSAVPLQ